MIYIRVLTPEWDSVESYWDTLYKGYDPLNACYSFIKSLFIYKDCKDVYGNGSVKFEWS